MKKNNFTKEDILNKVFLPSSKGYDSKEVDEFLDLIIRDYEYFNNEINALREENEKLKKGIKASPKEEYKSKHGMINSSKNHENIEDIHLSSASRNLNNLELLRRCALYEKRLYELKEDPSKIK